MAEQGESGTDKVLVTVAAIVAGVVAQRVVMLGWRVVRGPEPSKDDDSSFAEMLVFGVISAAAVSAARTWTTHKARSRETATRGA